MQQKKTVRHDELKCDMLTRLKLLELTFNFVKDIDGSYKKLDTMITSCLFVLKNKCVVDMVRMMGRKTISSSCHWITIDFCCVIFSIFSIKPCSANNRWNFAAFGSHTCQNKGRDFYWKLTILLLLRCKNSNPEHWKKFYLSLNFWLNLQAII